MADKEYTCGLGIPNYIRRELERHYIISIVFVIVTIFLFIHGKMFNKWQSIVQATVSSVLFANHFLLIYFDRLFLGKSIYDTIVLIANICLAAFIAFLCLNDKVRYLFTSIGTGYICTYIIMLVFQISTWLTCILIIAISSIIFLGIANLKEKFLYPISISLFVPFILEVIFNNLFIRIFSDMQLKPIDGVLPKKFIGLISRFALVGGFVCILSYELFIKNRNCVKEDSEIEKTEEAEETV